MFMMKAVMPVEQLDLLSSVKGKTLKSLEYVPEADTELAYGIVRLNFGRSSLIVTCEQVPAMLFDEPEDVAVLAVASSDPKGSMFTRDVLCLDGVVRRMEVPETKLSDDVDSQVPRRYLVGERVTGVEVVREHVLDPEDGATFDMDVTVAVRTRHRTVGVSRGIWFGEVLDVRRDLPPDVAADAIQPVSVTWQYNDHAEVPDVIEREVIVL